MQIWGGAIIWRVLLHRQAWICCVEMWCVEVRNVRPECALETRHVRTRTNERMAPPSGLSTPRAPKELFLKIRKVIWSRSRCFSYGLAPYYAWAKLLTVFNHAQMDLNSPKPTYARNQLMFAIMCSQPGAMHLFTINVFATSMFKTHSVARGGTVISLESFR